MEFSRAGLATPRKPGARLFARNIRVTSIARGRFHGRVISRRAEKSRREKTRLERPFPIPYPAPGVSPMAAMRFYFDFMSPFSYLAFERAMALAQQIGRAHV